MNNKEIIREIYLIEQHLKRLKENIKHGEHFCICGGTEFNDVTSIGGGVPLYECDKCGRVYNQDLYDDLYTYKMGEK